MSQSQGRWPIIALVGQTNTGKSSLFNALLRRRRAIVAREPGTTRDSLGELVEIGPQRAWLVDTAGAKKPEDEFETTIQAQLEAVTATADIVLLVVEAPKRITAADRALAKQALKAAPKVILVVNKVDQNAKATPADFQNLGVEKTVLTSTTTGRGLDDLIDCLAGCLPEQTAKAPGDPDWTVALVGRPNTGKSSLFNALAAKQQALVSPQAGTTRDVNRQAIRYHGLTIDLLDTAGIRRPGQTKGIEQFSYLRTLAAINQADVCLLVVEAGEVGTAADQRIAGLIKQAAKGLLILINKWDLVDPQEAERVVARVRAALEFVPWAHWLTTSPVTDHNLAKIWPRVSEIMTNRQRQLDTNELAGWLAAAADHHPPAGKKGIHPQLRVIKQLGHSPPTFKVSGPGADQLHWGYQRFLDNRLRQQFDLSGTGVRWLFEGRRPAKRHQLTKAGVSGNRLRGFDGPAD